MSKHATLALANATQDAFAEGHQVFHRRCTLLTAGEALSKTLVIGV